MGALKPGSPRVVTDILSDIFDNTPDILSVLRIVFGDLAIESSSCDPENDGGLLAMTVGYFKNPLDMFAFDLGKRLRRLGPAGHDGFID